MAFCTSCGAQVKGAFCEQCGTPVSAAGAGAPPPGTPAMTPPPMSAPQMSAPQMSPGAAVPPPQMATRKTNPLVWILLGVLGLIAICFVGCIVTVGYFARNPGVALAKLITASNPNAEVVSTDSGAQTITIRDKKTGVEVTMSFDDIKAGKFKMRAIGKNGEVANVEIGAGTGKIPSWVPVYPGASAMGNLTASGTDGSDRGAGGVVTYQSSDSPDKVFSFYKVKIDSLGMKIESETGDGQEGSIHARDDDDKRTLVISVTRRFGGSTIALTFSEKR